MGFGPMFSVLSLFRLFFVQFYKKRKHKKNKKLMSEDEFNAQGIKGKAELELTMTDMSDVTGMDDSRLTGIDDLSFEERGVDDNEEDRGTLELDLKVNEIDQDEADGDEEDKAEK